MSVDRDVAVAAAARARKIVEGYGDEDFIRLPVGLLRQMLTYIEQYVELLDDWHESRPIDPEQWMWGDYARSTDTGSPIGDADDEC